MQSLIVAAALPSLFELNEELSHISLHATIIGLIIHECYTK